MNKLYSVILKSSLFILLIGFAGALRAQITQSNLNLTINSTRNWSSNFAPGNVVTTCNACNVTVASGATLTFDVSVNFGSNNPSSGGGSTIDVTGSSKLIIGSATGTTSVLVSLTNSQIIVGDPSLSTTNIASGNASLFVGSGATLALNDNISTVRLANQNNTISAGAGGNSFTSNAGAGQILYTPGSLSFFSGNANYNTTNGNIGGVYSTPPPKVTGPAVSQVATKAGITLVSFGSAPIILPITLVDFAASLNSNGGVNLTWATEQEENSSYFAVQRSVNGGAWTTIGKVAARGNSSLQTNYSFTDASPVSGTDSYRLLETDLDGAITYSTVKVVRTTSQSTGFSIFPNPVSDQLNVSLSSSVNDATIRLVDLNGRVLVEQKVANAGGTIVTLPVQSFVRGTYVLVVRTAEGSQFTGKVLITH